MSNARVKTTKLSNKTYRTAALKAVADGEVHHVLVKEDAQVFDEMPRRLQPKRRGKARRGAYVEALVWVDEEFARDREVRK